jgi:hypothetical protein
MQQRATHPSIQPFKHLAAQQAKQGQLCSARVAQDYSPKYGFVPLAQSVSRPASLLHPAGLLKEAVNDAQHTKVLIDGFPRVLDQLKEFEREVCARLCA